MFKILALNKKIKIEITRDFYGNVYLLKPGDDFKFKFLF